MHRLHYAVCVSLFLLIILTSCNMSVNNSIQIPNGTKELKSLNSVNGNIIIGSDCDIKGTARSVNGFIQIGDNSRIRTVQTVNGPINLETGVYIDGNAESVNGAINTKPKCIVDGSVESINGSITLTHTTVEKAVTTFNGDISLKQQSIINGNIHIKKTTGQSDHQKTLTITISDSSVVKGDIIVAEPEHPVVVVLRKGGKVIGKVEHAEVKEELQPETNDHGVITKQPPIPGGVM
jgi:hypothetical protein